MRDIEQLFSGQFYLITFSMLDAHRVCKVAVINTYLKKFITLMRD